MKNIKFIPILLIVFGCVALYSCSDDEPDTPTPTPTKVTYTANAAAILNASCATSGCHTSGAPVGSLQGYADAKNFAGFGRMMGAVNHQTGFSPMPKNGTKLSDEKIATLQSWIDDGLLE